MAAQRARHDAGRAGARAAVRVDDVARPRPIGPSTACSASTRANVLVAQLNLPERNYSDAETRRRFITDVIDAMRAIPAVSEIGATSIIPNGVQQHEPPLLPRGRGRAGARSALRAAIAARTSGYFRGDEDSAASAAACSTIPIASTRRRSRSSARRSPASTGATRIRSASDSSWRSTDRGSRWSASRATSCTTGSCGEFETVYRPISQTRRTRWRSRCAPSAIRSRWPAICGAPSRRSMPISRSRR